MTEAWEILFDAAMRCLDSCRGAFPPWAQWSFGGGTALMLHLHHRRSRDIDIFLNDVQLLPCLSPRLNGFTEELAQSYVEAMNYVKLTLPQGEIDFIVAPHLTDEPWRETAIRGRKVLLETPVEIVLKKLFYRADGLQTRDIFDAAAVVEHCGSELERSAGILAPKLDILTARIERTKTRYQVESSAILDVPPAWQALLNRAPEVLADFLERLRRRRPFPPRERVPARERPPEEMER